MKQGLHHVAPFVRSTVRTAPRPYNQEVRDDDILILNGNPSERALNSARKRGWLIRLLQKSRVFTNLPHQDAPTLFDNLSFDFSWIFVL
jgi:hypothetical protein